MRRSLLAPALIGPVLYAYSMGWPIVGLGAGCAAIALLSYVLSQQEDIETGAAQLGRITTGLFAKVSADLPVYVAGVGAGVRPVTDWYTAHVDGQTVLILEPVEMPSAK